MSSLKTAAIRIGITPGAILVPLLCGLGTPALAEGGTELTFNLGVRLSRDSNPDLTPVSSGQRTSAGLDLSFGLTSATALSTLTLQGAAGLLTGNGSGPIASGLTDPSLTLAYARTGANSQFTVDGALRQADVSGGDVTNFQTGTGLRRTADLSSGLSFGTGGPLGFGLNAGITAIRYSGTTDPDLIDSRTVRLGADLRADLSPVLRASLGLQESRFRQDGQAARDTLGLSAGLTLDRPNGALSLRFAAEDTPDGQRLGLTFEHRMDLSSGTLTYSLGATQGVTDKTYLTGAVSYVQDLPNGAMNIGLSRAVAAGAETNSETVLSRATVSYSKAITPRANLALALDWAKQRDTATDLSTANTSLSATWTQDVTQDWALDLGYSRRLRDQDGVGTGQSNQVFITFRRAFSLRF